MAKGRSLPEVLGAISGLRTDEAKKLMQQVQENLDRLDKCPGHVFIQIRDDGGKRTSLRYRCSVCEGTVGNTEFMWYMRGYRHGKEQGRRECGGQ